MRAAAVLALGWALLAVQPGAAESGSALALDRLTGASTTAVSVYRNPATRAPYFVRAKILTSSFTDATLAARQGTDFWSTYGGLFGVREPAQELVLRKQETDLHGVTHLRYDQRYRGLPVFGRQLLLHLQ